MSTIREKLAELDCKIFEAASQSEVAAEYKEQYRIRYLTALGKSFSAAVGNHHNVKIKLARAQYEVDEKQRLVDVLKSELEAAELTLNILGNQEAP